MRDTRVSSNNSSISLLLFVLFVLILLFATLITKVSGQSYEFEITGSATETSQGEACLRSLGDARTQMRKKCSDKMVINWDTAEFSDCIVVKSNKKGYFSTEHRSKFNCREK